MNKESISGMFKTDKGIYQAIEFKGEGTALLYGFGFGVPVKYVIDNGYVRVEGGNDILLFKIVDENTLKMEGAMAIMSPNPFVKVQDDNTETNMTENEQVVIAYINLGKNYEEKKEYSKAIEEYKKGLEKDSNHIMLHNNIGGAYMYMKMYQKAELEFKKELEKHSENSNAVYNLGLAYKALGRESDAIEMWKQTLIVDSNFIYAYQQLANYYKQRGDMKTADIYIEKLKKKGY